MVLSKIYHNNISVSIVFLLSRAGKEGGELESLAKRRAVL